MSAMLAWTAVAVVFVVVVLMACEALEFGIDLNAGGN